MNDEQLKVVEQMEKYGGSFVQALAQCFYRADAKNFATLQLAFPEIWAEYEKLALTK